MLKISDFSCSCECNSYNIAGYYERCCVFSYEFTPNAYVLQGEIDCGAWAFACTISSACHSKSFTGQIQVNGKDISEQEAYNLACYVHQKYLKSFSFKKSIRKIIETNIKKYKIHLTADELFEKFGVPEHLHDRKPNQLGMYYPCFIAMDGLIKGKKIFTTAWQGQYGFNDYILNKISKALADYECIFIIPSTKKNKFNGNYIKVDMLSLYHEDIQSVYKDE